jgi:stress-induced morphogen
MTFTFDSCRICLNVKPESTVKALTVVPVDLGGLSYAQIYQQCIGLANIIIKSSLPSFLCIDCEKILIKLHRFRDKCLRTEVVLNDLVDLKEEPDDVPCDSENEPVLTEDDEDVRPLTPKEESEEEVDEKTAVKLKPKQASAKRKRRPPTEKRPKKDKTTRSKKYHYIHDGRKEICPECGKLIVHSYMKNHLLTHVEMTEEEKPFECPECKKRFKFASVLATHKKTHSDDRKFKCEFCELTFKRSDSRRYHVMIKHLDEKPNACTLCPMRFSHPHHLVRHARVHTLERKFECELCKKKLASKASVIEHMVTHTNQMDFICDVCSKAFRTKKYLKRHYVVHTGEKNYSCQICGEKFAYNVLLKAHAAKIHPDYVPPPSGTLISERAIRRLDESNKKFVKIGKSQEAAC